jgi:hypothetical protein
MPAGLADLRLILNALWADGPQSRRSLTQALEIASGTVAVGLSELEQRGLVREAPTHRSTGGRPLKRWAVVADARTTIGVTRGAHAARRVDRPAQPGHGRPRLDACRRGRLHRAPNAAGASAHAHRAQHAPRHQGHRGAVALTATVTAGRATSAPVTVPAANLAAPRARASRVGRSVRLAWPAVRDAKTYTVYASNGKGGWDVVARTHATSWVGTPPSAGASFRVAAQNQGRYEVGAPLRPAQS